MSGRDWEENIQYIMNEAEFGFFSLREAKETTLERAAFWASWS